MDDPARWRNYTLNHRDKGAPPVGTPREQPLEVLTEVLAERGIGSYSMLQPIAQIGADRAKFTCDEAHWSPIGHELIARAIFQHMLREELPERLMKERAANPRR
jgi:hypothetical protein